MVSQQTHRILTHDSASILVESSDPFHASGNQRVAGHFHQAGQSTPGGYVFRLDLR
jgi:hypothetical protein